MAGLLYAIGPLFFVFIMSNFIMAFLAWPYGLLKFATRDAPGVPQVRAWALSRGMGGRVREPGIQTARVRLAVQDIRRMLGMLWQRMRHRAPSNRHMEKWFKVRHPHLPCYCCCAPVEFTLSAI